MRWWDSATGRLHVQPRLRLNVVDDDRVCGNHGHLRCLWSRTQMRRCCGTARCVRMQCRILLARWCHDDMHGDDGVMHDVYCRKLLQWCCSSASGVQLHGWVLRCRGCGVDVFRHGRVVRAMWRRLGVRWRDQPTNQLHVYCGVCVDLDDLESVRCRSRHVRSVWSREVLFRRWCATHRLQLFARIREFVNYFQCVCIDIVHLCQLRCWGAMCWWCGAGGRVHMCAGLCEHLARLCRPVQRL